MITFITPIWQPHRRRKSNKNTQVGLCNTVKRLKKTTQYTIYAMCAYFEEGLMTDGQTDRNAMSISRFGESDATEEGLH